MRDVRLVEVHSDGEHLVLADASGEQYRLPIDDQLRAAARRDVAWLNRLRVDGQEDLRPRDIQARIRAGMSADELAEVSGMPLERIRRYEWPVLAERGHVADTAQRVAVARSGKVDTTLADAVNERLAARGAGEGIEWDAWREDGGTWIVQATFEAGGRLRSAQWRYEIDDQTLEPVDDESRWLTAQPELAQTTGVRERIFDVEADGAVRETTDSSDVPVQRDAEGVRSGEDPQARTLDLLDALRGRRGKRQPIGDNAEEQPDLVDSLLDGDTAPPPAASHPDPEDSWPPPARPNAQPGPAHPGPAQPGTAHPGTAQPEPAQPEPDQDQPEPASRAAVVSLPKAPTTDAADRPPAGSEPAPRGRPRRANKRASVPSWDDIMFGARKD